eukprot:167631-Chlamydomonas_euryale.AAC.1
MSPAMGPTPTLQPPDCRGLWECLRRRRRRLRPYHPVQQMASRLHHAQCHQMAPAVAPAPACPRRPHPSRRQQLHACILGLVKFCPPPTLPSPRRGNKGGMAVGRVSAVATGCLFGKAAASVASADLHQGGAQRQPQMLN